MLSHADGDSIFMTSAPISASLSVANGPAHIIVRSRTRNPASGSCRNELSAASTSDARGTEAADAVVSCTSEFHAKPGNGRPGMRSVEPSTATTSSQKPRSAGVSPASTSAGVITIPNGTRDCNESSRIWAIVRSEKNT